jgi:hypothetical protein
MTWACFLPCYWGQIPSYQLAAGSQKQTEICLRSFGQIARRRRGVFLRSIAHVVEKTNSWAIKGCVNMRQ